MEEKRNECTDLQRKLANHITSAMIGHHLTIADLKAAVKLVKKAYETDGLIKCADGHIKPLD